VASLGSVCFAAKSLEQFGLRMFKLPFDWVHSSPYMVRHALCDNFKAFLDKSQYGRGAGSSRDGTGGNNGTTHRLYCQMLASKKKNVLFPHHKLWKGSHTAQDDYASFKRSVSRMRLVLKQRSRRTLFVITCLINTREALDAVRSRTWPGPAGRGKCPAPEEGGHELCSVAEVERLFEELKSRAGGFHLDVVYLVNHKIGDAKTRPKSDLVLTKGSASAKVRERQTLSVHEMHCTSANTGLFFKSENDTNLLKQILMENRNFDVESLDGSGTKGFKDDVSSGSHATSSSSTASPASSSRSPVKRQAMKRSKPSAASNLFEESNLCRGIRVEQDNPKRPGGDAHARYEKYKKAKTVKQFLQLGGPRATCISTWNEVGLPSPEPGRCKSLIRGS